MTVFVVGKLYRAHGSGCDPIAVIRRTDKTIWVRNSRMAWRMRVKQDLDGNEVATDSSVPRIWRDEFTYFSSCLYE